MSAAIKALKEERGELVLQIRSTVEQKELALGALQEEMARAEETRSRLTGKRDRLVERIQKLKDDRDAIDAAIAMLQA